MLPPLRRVTAVQPHVVKARDVRQLVLADRHLEFRLVDLRERGIVRVQQLQRRAEIVAPAAMAELDRKRVVAKAREQRLEIVVRLRRLFEARRELREQRANLSGGGERLDALPERVDFRHVELRHARDFCMGVGFARGLLVHRGMRELAIELQREFKALGSPAGPSSRDVTLRLPVEGCVDLDGVEMVRIEGELIEL